MKKTKEKRVITLEQWTNLRNLIENDHIRRFNEIFGIVSGTAFASEIGMHYETLRVRKQSPKSFSYRETARIASKVGVSKDMISKLVNNQIDADVSKKG